MNALAPKYRFVERCLGRGSGIQVRLSLICGSNPKAENMRSIQLLASALLAVFASVCQAQGDQSVEMRVESQVDLVRQELGLSAGEVATLRALLLRAEDEARPLREAVEKTQNQIDQILSRTYDEFEQKLPAASKTQLAGLKDSGKLDDRCSWCSGCGSEGQGAGKPSRPSLTPAEVPKKGTR